MQRERIQAIDRLISSAKAVPRPAGRLEMVAWADYSRRVFCWSVFQIPKAKELQAKRPLHASAASLEARQGKSSEGLRVHHDSTWE